MARYRGPVCRLCRREGVKLYLKGQRCIGPKCALERQAYPPGQHGQGRSKLSTYGLQLREKQKAKRYYGILERQFRRHFRDAARMRGVTALSLLQILERRLDNIVYRLGFAPSRAAARQLVRHGHITVDGRKVNIPSYLVDVGQTIAVRERSRQLRIITESLEAHSRRQPLHWLETNPETFSGRLLALPQREDIQLPVKERMIVELYSK